MQVVDQLVKSMKNLCHSIKNNNKPTIDGVVIVEGKTDTQKLSKLFNVETVETNGLNLKQETIDFIKELAKTKQIILFLDPDGPGEKIRRRLVDELKTTVNIFIDKKDINFENNSKIGVAEAYDQAIIAAFNNYVVFSQEQNQTLSWDDYLSLDLNSKIKRQALCDKLHISPCNNKQLFKRLNMMNIKLDDIKRIL